MQLFEVERFQINGKDSLIKLVSYLAMFIGAQRFILPDAYAFACVPMLMLALSSFKANRRLFNSLFLLSLFLSVDQGADIYSETHAYLRYIIYFSGLAVMITNFRADTKKLVYFILAMILWIVIMLANTNTLDLATLKRDILLIFLIGILVTSTAKSLEHYEIDLRFLSFALVVYIIAELLNIAIHFDYDKYGYLSYDSTKSLLVVSSVYMMVKNKFLMSLTLTAVTIFVLLQYGTRMILFALFFGTLLYSGVQIIQANRIKSIKFLVALSFLGFIVMNNLAWVEDFKLVSSLARASDSGSLVDFIKSLDKVRFAEHQLFFDRNVLSILFGSGLGAGLYDVDNLLGFVKMGQAAFTIEELNNRFFVNFHDMWIDIGLRIGLIPVLLFYWWLVVGVFSKEPKIISLSIALFVFATCALFSTSGLILGTFLALSLRYENSNSRDTVRG